MSDSSLIQERPIAVDNHHQVLKRTVQDRSYSFDRYISVKQNNLD